MNYKAHSDSQNCKPFLGLQVYATLNMMLWKLLHVIMVKSPCAHVDVLIERLH